MQFYYKYSCIWDGSECVQWLMSCYTNWQQMYRINACINMFQTVSVGKNVNALQKTVQ
jgi:hypothetical protein